mmetsp:Transcript_7400/g.22426  ORF Transcript_7400/g.22426 Transcript_7400/m.22426 type:complete len:254 (-) Transcript_7400:1618-2379(-)
MMRSIFCASPGRRKSDRKWRSAWLNGAPLKSQAATYACSTSELNSARSPRYSPTAVGESPFATRRKSATEVASPSISPPSASSRIPLAGFSLNKATPRSMPILFSGSSSELRRDAPVLLSSDAPTRAPSTLSEPKAGCASPSSNMRVHSAIAATVSPRHSRARWRMEVMRAARDASRMSLAAGDCSACATPAIAFTERANRSPCETSQSKFAYISPSACGSRMHFWMYSSATAACCGSTANSLDDDTASRARR